jgi:hypothetical protein
VSDFSELRKLTNDLELLTENSKPSDSASEPFAPQLAPTAFPNGGLNQSAASASCHLLPTGSVGLLPSQPSTVDTRKQGVPQCARRFARLCFGLWPHSVEAS